jgi:hypothetical protein
MVALEQEVEMKVAVQKVTVVAWVAVAASEPVEALVVAVVWVLVVASMLIVATETIVDVATAVAHLQGVNAPETMELRARRTQTVPRD